MVKFDSLVIDHRTSPEAVKQALQSLALFRSLIKDGCRWDGDIVSKKWSEVLYFDQSYILDKVRRTVDGLEEGVDYKIEGLSIWIA